MKNSIPVVAGLIVITTSFLTGCASTSSSTSSSSSQTPSTSSVQTPATSGVQTPTTASTQATSSPTATTVANTSVATCQTQHLTLTQGRVGVATGSTYVTYYLQNQGPSICSMIGYPGFSLLFANGSVIQHPATRNGTAYALVQLKPGQRAQFVARTVNAAISGSGCSISWKSAEVQVYPPNQTVSIRQPSTIAACDLSVGPVSAA
jgi:cytoskeletal protein RodZ